MSSFRPYTKIDVLTFRDWAGDTYSEFEAFLDFNLDLDTKNEAELKEHATFRNYVTKWGWTLSKVRHWIPKFKERRAFLQAHEDAFRGSSSVSRGEDRLSTPKKEPESSNNSVSESTMITKPSLVIGSASSYDGVVFDDVVHDVVTFTNGRWQRSITFINRSTHTYVLSKPDAKKIYAHYYRSQKAKEDEIDLDSSIKKLEVNGFERGISYDSYRPKKIDNGAELSKNTVENLKKK